MYVCRVNSVSRLGEKAGDRAERRSLVRKQGELSPSLQEGGGREEAAGRPRGHQQDKQQSCQLWSLSRAGKTTKC